MAESPNTNPFNSYSASWTQPYLPTSFNPFYERVKDLRVEEELDRLEAVDRIVQNQLTYPEAEAIINRVKQQRGQSND